MAIRYNAILGLLCLTISSFAMASTDASTYEEHRSGKEQAAELAAQAEETNETEADQEKIVADQEAEADQEGKVPSSDTSTSEEESESDNDDTDADQGVEL